MNAAMPNPGLPIVYVFALGGTIAMAPAARVEGVVPTRDANDLVAAVPRLNELAEIRAVSFRRIPSAHLTFDDLEALSEAIGDAEQEGAQGIVITQGTDTIEETAFALDRISTVDIPVVITGAMRVPTAAGADGPGNLLAAVQVALSKDVRGLGAVVVLNDEIHAARFVRKTHTSSPAAFASPGVGPIGLVVENRPRILTRPPGVAPLRQARKASPVRTALVTVALGDDGTLVDLIRDRRFDGLVVEATGGGHVPEGLADALERAAKAMPVLLASRTGAGEVLTGTYGFTGGEIDLQKRGLIRTGMLDGLKSHMLLNLLLRRGLSSRAEIIEAFKPWGGG
ncbi:MAG: asparaginase [Candidimonas sp.]